MQNYMRLEIPAKSSNESLARSVVAAFAAQLDITIEDMSDIKTAVSEAVTNSIIHGYVGCKGVITIICRMQDGELEVVVEDQGCGIEDVEKARQPLYSTYKGDERSGMGFTVMETFMDSLEVYSELNEGTRVHMRKRVGDAVLSVPSAKV